MATKTLDTSISLISLDDAKRYLNIGIDRAQIVTIQPRPDSGGDLGGTYFEIASPSTEFYVWFDVDDGSVDPAVSGKTGVEVDIASGSYNAAIGGAVASALDALSCFNASWDLADETVTVENTMKGTPLSELADGAAPCGFRFKTTQTGLDDDPDSDDEVIDLVNAASAAINNHLGYTVKLTSHTEYVNGKGHGTIMVDHRPITEDSNDVAVYLDATRNFGADTAVDHADLGIDTDSGIIELPAVAPKGIRTVKVAYDAGYADGSIPEDMQEACKQLVRYYQSRRRSEAAGVASITVGDGSATYTTDSPMPSTVQAILDRYR